MGGAHVIGGHEVRPISHEQRADILSSLRVGCDLDASCKAQGVAAADARALMGADVGWQADVVAATGVGADARKAAFAEVAAHSAALDVVAPPAEKAVPRAKGTAADAESDPAMPRDTLWERFQQTALDEYGPGRWGLYLLQDEKLALGGLPPTSAWWRKTFFEFFASDLTWLIAMVGRGAGKSTNLERMLLIIVLWTQRNVPHGQHWTCPFMSVVKEDALRRLSEIQSLLLLAYGLEVAPKNQGLRTPDAFGNWIDIISTAGTVGQSSGQTTVGGFFDEAAKAPSAPGAANLDTEIIASIVGTSRENVGWAGVRCSSAWETRGAHFANCVEGTNSENYVATIGTDFIDSALAGYEDVARWESSQGNTHGAAQIRSFAKLLHPGSPNVATWVARPTLTAIRSRMKLETLPPDDPALDGLSRFDYWIREYGSMPLSREDGPRFDEQCHLAASVTRRLSEKHGQGPQRPPEAAGVMKVHGAHPGDARYAGPTQRARGGVAVGWRKRTVI